VLRDAADDNSTSSPARQRIHVIVNWIEKLERQLGSE
jgi:hypothetical protein